MSKIDFKFPEGFLWGSSTSSHQVEGGNKNQWTVWEKKNAQRLAQEAEANYSFSPVWSQIKGQAQNPQNYISSEACRHWQLFEDDFNLLKELNQNAYRFSLEWSRLEPEEGQFNQEALRHYQKMIDALSEKGIEPFITLWHWTLPVWLEEKDGLLAKDFEKYFEKFTEFVCSNLKGVKFWLTLNEPTVFILNSYLKGIWPPQKKSLWQAKKAYTHLVAAHKNSYQKIHQLLPGTRVSLSHNISDYEPVGFLDKITCFLLNKVSNEKILNDIRGCCDFLAVQYYFHNRLKFFKIKNENEKISDLGWEVYPKGLFHILKKLKKYNLPVYITENGLADLNDKFRADFISDHLFWVAQAMKEGVDVKGYFYWSLLDNFEWDKGFWPRFGLVEINYQTYQRKIRPSAFRYKKICQNNQLKKD